MLRSALQTNSIALIFCSRYSQIAAYALMLPTVRAAYFAALRGRRVIPEKSDNTKTELYKIVSFSFVWF